MNSCLARILELCQERWSVLAAGYDVLVPADSPAAKLLCQAGCVAHARRYFEKAHAVAPRETEALAVVKRIAELYAVEAQARQQGLEAAGRLALRQEKSVRVIAELKGQIQKLQAGALPKSALGRACHYALGQWERLEVFLKDSRIEIDNNLRCAMKSLQDHLTEYVAARRALGTRLEEPAQTLRRFVKFLARKKARFITIQLALEWSQQSRAYSVQPGLGSCPWFVNLLAG